VDRIAHRVHLATGVTVPYLEQGDPSGTAVLLLHPWVESSGCFDMLLPALPSTLHVFAMDQRGHGGADQPGDRYALVDFADDIEAFMDAVGLPSAVLLGASSGGYVAQQVAVQARRRVAGLVLVGPRGACAAGQPSPTRWICSPTRSIPPWVEESLTWFPRYNDVPDWYVEDRIRDGLRVPAHVWRAGLAGLTAAVPPSESGTITAPTLIVWGDRDCCATRKNLPRSSPAPGSWCTKAPVTSCCGSSLSAWPETWWTSSTACKQNQGGPTCTYHLCLR
jgi:pimeloyl-ACP methyl ester carboxylesterase